MLSRPKSALPLAALCALLSACNDNNFASSGSGAAKEEAGGDTCETGVDCGPPQPTNDACVDGDTVNIQWTGPVKECLDQGKTFNFEEQKCAEMRQSQFACDWSTLKAELSKKSLLSSKLSADADQGAKLVSCGQSDDGNRIVVQWIKSGDLKNIDCTDGQSSHHITTGCYTVYTSEDQRPPEPANEQERAKQVYGCMNKL